MGLFSWDGAFDLFKDVAKRVSPDKDLQVQLENEFKQMMLNGEHKKYEADVEDRKSAREREIKTGSHMNAVLAVLIAVSFISCIVALLFLEVPERSENILYLLTGILGNEFAKVMNYYFGSSQGSKQKTEFMAKNKGS